MSLKNDYLKWKIGHINKPFVEDDRFFEERYHTVIPPLLKDLFKELMELEERISELEHCNDDDCEESCS